MPTPEQTSQRWKHLGTESSEETDGTLNLHTTFMEMNTGETFVVSISGRGKSNVVYWTGAMMAAVAYIRESTGLEPLAGTRFVTDKSN